MRSLHDSQHTVCNAFHATDIPVTKLEEFEPLDIDGKYRYGFKVIDELLRQVSAYVPQTPVDADIQNRMMDHISKLIALNLQMKTMNLLFKDIAEKADLLEYVQTGDQLMKEAVIAAKTEMEGVKVLEDDI